MISDQATAYKSGSQRARVVTEFWAEQNLYCPNCTSPSLGRLRNNTRASDFSCPSCKFWFQLKGQKSRIGSSITDGAYGAMMHAIRSDQTPNFYFLHYDLATWTIRNLLLIPSFAFPPSAIIKRPPLSATARRAGWVGCNFDLRRVPVEARIELVTTQPFPRTAAVVKDPAAAAANPPGATIITPPSEVREKFRRVKPFKDVSVEKRGWMLDVLNIVQRISRVGSSRCDDRTAQRAVSTRKFTNVETGRWPVSATEFTNEDVYAFERELEALHPDNRHIRDKIRQQLQVLRDTGFLLHVGKGAWRVK